MWEVFSSITRALLRFHFTSSPGRLYAKAAQCQAILFLPTHPLSCRLLNNAICRSPLTKAAPFTAWKEARNAVIKSKNSDLQNNEQQLQQRNSEIVDDLYQKIREASDELMSRWRKRKMAKKEQCYGMRTNQLEKDKRIRGKSRTKRARRCQIEMGVKVRSKYKEMIEELEKENDSLAQKLTEMTNQLASSRNEYLQSHKAWQEEYIALQEKSQEEMAAKEQS
ncbi:hypothetical protein D9C73_025164 [Collichthys lucidus]|uniref:Uncharacterized protein n=1 Tax=Collichthys lucidus TaxID=240159 RepID=A0A4U5VS07_COLLU|nr:hypothetical protein D9C73_025164 [Collichthys lucidus]